MLIGCIAMIRRGNKMLGIQCNKGRGYILPGGKHEQGETFTETALRELREETGIWAKNPQLIFQAPDGFGYWVMTFLVEAEDLNPSGTAEMMPEMVTWGQLQSSKYQAYYELLEQAWESSKKAGMSN